MDLNLKGRVTVITGPAKGMGAAITMAFAAEGARLALLGRDVVAVEPVAEEARAAGAEAIVDSVRSDRRQAMRKRCRQGEGRVWPHRYPGERRRRLGSDR